MESKNISRLRQKQKELLSCFARTRIGHEGENLMGQVFGGHIYKTVLYAALDGLVFTVAVLLVHFLFTYYYPAVNCSLWCNLGIPQPICCPLGGSVVVYLLLLFLAVLLAKTLCIQGLTDGVFRHSALSDVLFLLVMTNVLFMRGVGIVPLVGVLLLIFLALFFGYRLGLKTTRTDG